MDKRWMKIYNPKLVEEVENLTAVEGFTDGKQIVRKVLSKRDYELALKSAELMGSDFAFQKVLYGMKGK